ncbi:MAG TPA: zinc-ribbon domain-containing protein [Geopsychrobacteraceae bacterium]|nr:zinc-ribbon domain-containing protein [Geopsychrobacteraceae bacterium]
MIINCPACKAAMRLDKVRFAGKRLSLRCPACQKSFKAEVPPTSIATVLIAHGYPKSFTELKAVLTQDNLTILTCSENDDALRLLRDNPVRILLLDVALTGSFPFELIEEAQNKSSDNPVKIILLPSVYNKTAYKRRPTSLYGADAYLELHHIGDRLLPLLRDLCPDLELRDPSAGFFRPAQGEERSLADVEGRQSAEELARLLIADIALYHQEQIERGVKEGNPALYLANEMTEGRRLLSERIAPAILKQQDFLLQALEHFATERHKEEPRL